MSCENSATCENVSRAKSPLKIAVAISLAIAAGTMLSTVDISAFETIASGHWLTGAFEEVQQRNTAAITSLERKAESFSRDLDFVVSRVGAAMRRNEDKSFDRFVQLYAEIAELKDKIALIQTARVTPPRAADPLLGGAEKRPDTSAEVSGLRTSLHELSNAHTGAVAAITRRLDRIEVMVGLSTDVTSSIADPLELKQARRRAIAKARKALPEPQVETTAERGHLFNVKPLTRQGMPLRLSRLAN
jgi:hypothetical protein